MNKSNAPKGYAKKIIRTKKELLESKNVRSGGMAHIIQSLPSKYGTLISNPSTSKTTNQTNKQIFLFFLSTLTC
jgi:hypothetical protein